MHHGPTLEVSLSAITRNYTLLNNTASGRTAAVVKANAYGLGAEQVAPALFKAGCRDFFVATLEEATQLREVIAKPTSIYVFHGLRAGQTKEFLAHDLIPVLNDPGQIALWNDAGPCAIHIDTGMRRLGLSRKELAALKKIPTKLKLVMSHLACAGDPELPMNQEQLDDFITARAYFPGIAASLANSSGIFLGPDYHFDLTRPGCSLYGISPNISLSNPVENVVTLSAPVLQYRTVEQPECVGYGATATVPAGTVLATVEMGYADGFLRGLSNKAYGMVEGVPVPLVGRVSMDMVSIDVTRVPEQFRTPDLRITFIGKDKPVDEMAKEAGTIGYEIFTRLGSRVKRLYV